MLSTVKDDPVKVRHAVARSWVEDGRRLSRAVISSLWIESWADSNIQQMIGTNSCEIEEDFYIDFVTGFSFVGGAIETGRKEMNGEDTDEVFREAYEHEGMRRSALDFFREREYAKRCAERLENDPTGISVVSGFYGDLKSGRWEREFSGSDQSLVLRGAGMAKKIYNAVYPLTTILPLT